MPHAGAIVPLVEVEPRLLSSDHIDPVCDSALDERHGIRQRSMQDAHAGRQALELAHVGIGALEDTCRSGGVDERGDDRLAPPLGAG